MLVEVILFVLLLLFFAVMKDRKPKQMPPGPVEIPFIGNAPLQYTRQLEAHRKKYGNIYTTRIGNIRTVVFCDYKTTKELLASLEAADRPEFFKIFSLDPTNDVGLFSANGLKWLHGRRFILRNLRDLGMGKTYLEEAINEEARALIEYIKKLGEKPSIYPRSLRTAPLNIVWQMIAGHRYDMDSHEVDKLFKILEDFRDSSFFLFFEKFFPIMRFIPSVVKEPVMKSYLLTNLQIELKRMLQVSIDEHKNKLDVDNPRDLIDEYLVEMDKPGDPDEKLFSNDALFQMIADLLGAGSDTTTKILKWTVFYMVKHPKTVERCQKEIDQVAARDNLVSITQKPDLPFVEAFVTETIRHSSMVIMQPLRCLSKDVLVDGYTIPKGTCISADNNFIHHDPDFWDEPATFRPERFIDENRKFHAKFGRTNTFGSGRRQCPGEQLARMEILLFTAALLQNFDIELPKGAKLNEDVIESLLSKTPVDQAFIYKLRK